MKLNDNDKERSEGIDVDEGVFDHLFLLNAMVVGGGAASMSKTHWPIWQQGHRGNNHLVNGHNNELMTHMKEWGDGR
jgi:hypothetical protein